jgi:ubiquinone/menaquinone biosynthesis C-methylase UbiE
MPGYETAGMEWSDTVCDVTKSLPFDDNTFDAVLASHVIEHVEWERTQAVLTDWCRVLKQGGVMTLWTPDFAKIIEVVLKADRGEAVTPAETEAKGRWMKQCNPQRDPYLWANFRIFSIDSMAVSIKFNRTHHSMFTFNHLKSQMEQAKLQQVTRLTCKPPYDHGWTNMGVSGVKA